MRLWQLTGGHPGRLKNVLDWLKRRNIFDLPADDNELIQALLGYSPINNYCRRLWENLTADEQSFLRRIDNGLMVEDVPSFFRDSGLLTDHSGQLDLFSPLWQAYLHQKIWPKQKILPMQVELDPSTRRVILQWQGRTMETVIRRKLVFDLLDVLSDEPGRVYSKDEIIKALYEDEQAPEVMDDALFQLVTALRRVLDPLVSKLCPDMTSSCIQNVRGVGYCLIVDLPCNK
jgi:DNA-binding response OmpR family regulator